MKASALNLFKKREKPEPPKGEGEHAHARPKAESAKGEGEHAHSRAKAGMSPVSETSFKSMPTWWVVLMGYGLAAVFWHYCHLFFQWFPPYLLEVFKHLHGLPTTWADLGLYWAERGLEWAAAAAAVYHQLWQVGTRYKLTSHDLHIQSWFPVRTVVSVPFGAIKKVGFQQGPLGLLFNYGNVQIDTASLSGPLVLLNCPKPKRFTDFLLTRVEPSRQSPGQHQH